MSNQNSEQETIRTQKKNTLEQLGINPYPPEAFNVTTYTTHILNNYQQGKTVTIAGRVTTRRVMGAASFADLQDSTGKIQLYIHRDSLCPKTPKPQNPKTPKPLN